MYHFSRFPRGARRFSSFAALSCFASFACLSLGAAAIRPAYAQKQQQKLPYDITVLRVNTGPVVGTYHEIKNDGRMIWYFCNSALLPWVNKTNQTAIQAYLDQYISHVDAEKGTIEDWAFTNEPLGSPPGTPKLPAPVWQNMPPDADDSNTSTFLSIAVKYVKATGDTKWWDANVEKMKMMTTETLLKPQKPSGLIKAKIKGVDTGFMMDNCENYKGLMDLASALPDDDPFAARCAEAADKVAKGIAGLYNKTNHKFDQADILGNDAFYADRMAQIFPQLFKVPLGCSKEETQKLYDAGWAYLNARGDKWETGTFEKRASTGETDKSVGKFPAMLVGYYAAAYGGKDDIARARKQMDYFNSKPKGIYDPGHIPEFTAIQEVSRALQLQAKLAELDEKQKTEKRVP